MIFSYFPSVKASKGRQLNRLMFYDVIKRDNLRQKCVEIAAEKDKDKRGELKKHLPIVTWQAYFEGKRLNSEAKPSGLFMLDIDHIEGRTPKEFYEQHMGTEDFKVEYRILLVHMTPSCEGLRVIAECYPQFKTLPECQDYLARALQLEKYDISCKDYARSSFLVPQDYFFYINDRVFMEEPRCVYNVEDQYGPNAVKPVKPFTENKEMGQMLDEAVDQREGLFGGITEYKGLELSNIAEEWLKSTGGMPEPGERNTRLYTLALRLRYITDYNEATLIRVMPNCGLNEEEMKQLIHSAVQTPHGQAIPRDLAEVIDRMKRCKDLVGEEGEKIKPISTDTSKLPPLPPVIRQWAEIAPDDFKKAVVLCQLPILGTLASKLRAKYIDGQIHSPSFQISLEAPQASGKSFMRKLVETELEQIITRDDEQRAKEREYDNKVREMKLLNIKVTKENKEEVLGSRPESHIRFVPATMSITKLLMRMNDAQGLHLFAFSEEIDTVTKAFKRGFTSYSDLLRVAFDNGLYGQDYASENSFSGIIPIFYNFLASGTPKAMRRFYPDVEDGLVSRVCFVTLPDQFGKQMPVWGVMDAKAKEFVGRKLIDLNEVSIVGDEVQPDHLMKLEFLNKELKNWILAQQAEAVQSNDRTRDIFCRRAAVVGFRAGMLAWFLYEEKNTPTIRRNVVKFAIWVASCMLNQHLLRFNIQGLSSNTIPHPDLFKAMPDKFTRGQLEEEMRAQNIESRSREILYKWRLAGLIEDTKGNVKNDTIIYKSNIKNKEQK